MFWLRVPTVQPCTFVCPYSPGASACRSGGVTGQLSRPEAIHKLSSSFAPRTPPPTTTTHAHTHKHRHTHDATATGQRPSSHEAIIEWKMRRSSQGQSQTPTQQNTPSFRPPSVLIVAQFHHPSNAQNRFLPSPSSPQLRKYNLRKLPANIISSFKMYLYLYPLIFTPLCGSCGDENC